MNYEIFTYNSGNFLRLVFTALATIFGTGDYLTLLKTGAIVGVLVVMVLWAFQGKNLSMPWLAGVIVLLVLGVFTKATVIVNDRVVPANSAVVADVPLALALPATVFSKIGDYFTRTFETTFNLPGLVQYSGNGLLFAQHLVQATTTFEITTPRIAANYSEFFKSCVSYDLLLERYSWTELLNSPDMNVFIAGNTSLARSFSYTPATGASTIVNCRAGYNGLMIPDLNAEIDASNTIYATRILNREASTAAAVSRFVSSVPVAYQILAQSSLSHSQIMSQNILSNALKRGVSNFASEAGTAGLAMEFTAARAEQERRTTFAVMGELSKKFLPILQGLFEAFIYAVFPFVLLMMMLPVGGKVFVTYIKALFWINLWPPLYAILNFAVTVHSQAAGVGAMVRGNSAGTTADLTAMTSTGLGQVMNDYAALSGYLAMSIPMIAWLMVSGSGAMMAGLAGRVLQSHEGSVTRASEDSAKGDYSSGNTKFETSTMYQKNTSPSVQSGGFSIGDGVGNALRIGSDGRPHSSIAKSDGPVSIDFKEAATRSARSRLSEATQQQETTSADLASSNAALFSTIKQSQDTIQQSESGKSIWGNASSAETREAHAELDRTVARVAESHGVSENTLRSVMGGAGVGGGIPLVNGKLSISGSKGVATTENSAKVQEALSDESLTNSLSRAASATLNLASSYELSDNSSMSDQLQSSSSRQVAASDRFSTSVAQVQSAEKGLENAHSVGNTLNISGLDGLLNFMEKEGILSRNASVDLISAASAGDSVAISYLREYSDSYVQSAASYTNTQASRSDLTRSGFGGMFDSNDSEQRALVSGGHSSVVQGAEEGRYAVDRASELALSNVAGDRTDIPNAQQSEDYRSSIATASSRGLLSPRTQEFMTPDSATDGVAQRISGVSATLSADHETQKDRGLHGALSDDAADVYSGIRNGIRNGADEFNEWVEGRHSEGGDLSPWPVKETEKN